MVDKEGSEYKVHLFTYSGMSLELYNIDCDAIRQVVVSINSRSLILCMSMTAVPKEGFTHFAVHFYTHLSVIIPKSIFYTNCAFKLSLMLLCLPYGSM